MCVLISSTNLSETFLILRRVERDTSIQCINLHVNYPVFLSGFNETWTFPIDFRKNTQMQNFMKIRQVVAEFFHADRRKTDRQTLRSDQPRGQVVRVSDY